ncbi:MAG: TonB-dependent receptor [Sulfurimonadaceae bacterium]
MNKTLLSLAALSALAYTASAASTVVLEPLTVSSTAIKTDELKSTDAVEVYTAEDIDKAHVQNVYEFLNQQTSVIAMPSYGNPFTQKLDMHGYGIGDGYQNIVITINGRRMNNIDMVPQLLSSISPASIDKIEIIKSSGIVTGGDGANAGVINITTKKNNDKELTLYGGTYGTADGSFYVGHSDEKLSISASGEAQKNDGVRYIDNNGNKDKNKLATGTFDVAYTPIEELELRLGASFARTDVIYAGFLTEEEYTDDPTQAGNTNWGATHQKYDTDVLNAGIGYYINEQLSLNIDGYLENKKSNYITYSSIADYKYNSLKTSFDFDSDLLSLSLGFDGFNGQRESATNETDKNNLAGFMMTQWYFGNASLKAGYRYEKVTYKYRDALADLKEDHGLHGVELGYNYSFSKEQSIFANYAHTYQAPDIDRFFSYGTFNGFIDPMTANNYTIGYNYFLPNNKFKISAYFIDLKNEIYYYADPAFINSKNTNIDTSHKYGIDLYDKWIISSSWNMALNYNYVQAIIDQEEENGEDYSDNKLPGVSNHNVKATLSYLPTPALTFALTEVYRSEAYAANDFGNDFTQKQDAYMSTDISATYAKEKYEIFAKINNLFNQSNGLWIQDDAIYPVNFTTTAIAGFKLKY